MNGAPASQPDGGKYGVKLAPALESDNVARRQKLNFTLNEAACPGPLNVAAGIDHEHAVSRDIRQPTNGGNVFGYEAGRRNAANECEGRGG
jgi:hypothetical protein